MLQNFNFKNIQANSSAPDKTVPKRKTAKKVNNFPPTETSFIDTQPVHIRAGNQRAGTHVQEPAAEGESSSEEAVHQAEHFQLVPGVRTEQGEEGQDELEAGGAGKLQGEFEGGGGERGVHGRAMLAECGSEEACLFSAFYRVQAQNAAKFINR